jgi:hypothetical protein
VESKEPKSEDASGSSAGSTQSPARQASPVLSDPPDSDKTSDLITEEVLRSRVRALIKAPPKRSRLEVISTNPTVAVVLGFVLTGIIGGFLAYYYAHQQQESAARRSFSDEINRTRVQKLGEVWELLDQDEFLINDILEKKRLEASDGDSAANNKRIDEIIGLIHRDQSLVNKYRYWLGEDLFQKTMAYLNLNIEYAVKNIGSTPGADLTDLLQRRDAARQDILQLRSLFLEGEPHPQEKPTAR